MIDPEILAAIISAMSVFLLWGLKEVRPYITRWLGRRSELKRLNAEQQANVNQYIVNMMMADKKDE